MKKIDRYRIKETVKFIWDLLVFIFIMLLLILSVLYTIDGDRIGAIHSALMALILFETNKGN